MRSHKDHKTIEGIITGDPLIINSFYQENLCYMRRYILGNYGNEEDVKDIFQDAIIIIYQKSILNLLHFNKSLEAYFYGICKNLWRNRLYRKKKIIHDSLLLEYEIEEVHFSNQPNFEKEAIQDLYQKYFLKLSDSRKKLLHLSLEGKSTKEISKITGYTEGYARKKKSNTKNDLKKMIRKDPIYKELIAT